jgi:hypothetical protein
MRGQRIMLVLLVGLDEHDGTRRRSILTSVKTIDSDGKPPFFGTVRLQISIL